MMNVDLVITIFLTESSMRTVDPFEPRYHIRDFLKFTAIVGVILALFSWFGFAQAVRAEWPMSVIYPLGLAVLCALSVMRPRAKSPRCESCGKRFIRARIGEQSGLCPACRVAKVSPEQHRRMAIQGFIIVIVLFLLLSIVLLYPFAGSIESRLGAVGYPIAAVGLFVILFVVFGLAMVVRFFVRMRLMNNPRYSLRAARACAREAGEESRFGQVSVHIFGKDDPTTMLKGQWETSRRRFESLIGERLEDDRPLRAFLFGNRNSFDRFFRWAFLYASNLEGTYVPWSRPTISVTTDFPAHRLADLERLCRVLFSYFNLDCYRKGSSPLWVQIGIANVIASGGDQVEADRLNRKMLAALSRGDSLGTADIFHISTRSVIKLVRDWRDFDNFRKYTQLTAQSSSVVEFLCSRADRLERFRAFLGERTKKSSTEEAFERHFGHGFETLLERWRSWVLDRGIGSHRPPPPEIRDALLERVIPIAQDPNAIGMDRIQAIREMGRIGYVLGADALIDLLGQEDQIPAEEIIWSLESMSGLAFGNHVERWMDWFDHLPSNA
jgi:hypothetical protein